MIKYITCFSSSSLWFSLDTEVLADKYLWRTDQLFLLPGNFNDCSEVQNNPFSSNQSCFRKPVYSRHFPQNKTSKSPMHISTRVDQTQTSTQALGFCPAWGQLLLH